MKTLIVCLSVLVFPLLFSSCSRKDPLAGRPNIICIFSDELDPAYLSSYGGSFPTPNLDRLAEDGMRFTAAYSAASMCTPSRFGLLTGMYPGRCMHPKFRTDFPKDEPYSIAWNTYIDPSVRTIARQLSASGYRTGMTGKWHTGLLPQGVSFPKFESDEDPADPAVLEKLRRYQEVSAERVMTDAGFDYASSVLWGNFDGFPLHRLRHHNFPWITRGAVKFIEESTALKEPFFLYVATTAVHGPGHVDMFNHDLRYTPEGYLEDVLDYQPPDELIKDRVGDVAPRDRHKYAGIACLDHHTGIILDKIADLGLEENTIIVFMADHNIEPGKSTCYEKGCLVPLIIKWPGMIKEGSVEGSLVQSTDLLPTLLAAAGIELTGDQPCDGTDLGALFDNSAGRVRDHVYLEAGYCRGITDGKYKYIAFRPTQEAIEKMESGTVEMAINHLNSLRQAHAQIALESYPGYFDQDQLYDLENDPYEQHNLAADPAYGDVLMRMKDILGSYLESFDNPFSLEEIPFMDTEQYRELAKKSVAMGTDWIPWFSRDHSGFTWPPEE